MNKYPISVDKPAIKDIINGKNISFIIKYMPSYTIIFHLLNEL